MLYIASLGLLLTILCPQAGFAQGQSEQQEGRSSLSLEWQAWKSENLGAWQIRVNPAKGAAQSVYGGLIQPLFSPKNSDDWEELCRQYLDGLRPVTRIPDSTLLWEGTQKLSLAAAGTTDKVVGKFSQAVDGVPVHHSSIRLILTPAGGLLAIESQALPDAHQISLNPSLDIWSAVTHAHQAYQEIEGKKADFIGTPQLVIVSSEKTKVQNAVLAWRIEMRTSAYPGTPSGQRIFVDAQDGTLVWQENLVHRQDLSGNVQSWATPGTLPDTSSNAEALFPMSYLKVTSNAGNATTDASGNFSIPYSGTSNVDVSFSFDGNWCWVDNNGGSDYSLTQSFQGGVPSTVEMNPAKSALITAEANAFKCVNEFHDWLKEIDPTDSTMDIRLKANVNISSTCNAYYDGSSINFYRAGGGCVNTSYSTVVAHEEGHWANDRYGSGNGWDGFGEGNADVYAMYLYDTPVVGEGFSGGSGYIRDGNNSRQFCGDNNRGCYGEVHADGEVLMGALWKVREELNNSLGQQAGDLTADTLFFGWMNAYNDSGITTAIEEHWLVLDDNDGNIGNGTPNYAEIDDGFRQQGFPGIDLDFIAFDHQPLEDTTNEAGPYVAVASITPLMGSGISSASLVYSVDEGSEITISMAMNGLGDWIGEIPGQVSPARVTYHLEAEDDLGNEESYPDGPDFEFVVGQKIQIYFNDFEAVGDDGWTHGQVTLQDDWQRGTPQGLAGDPSSAYQGNNVWANDLGMSGWNGEYKPNVSNYLRSPEIDCTGVANIHLRFARWLTVEERQYDQARVKINGTVVWENEYDGNTIDTAWSMVDYDISQFADNRPDTKIRFTLESDGGLEFGGWNIDNVELYALMASGDSNLLLLSGDQTATAPGNVQHTISGGPPDKAWWLIWSFSDAGSVIYGHNFDIGSPWRIASHGRLDTAGAITIDSYLPPHASGRTVYLEGAANDWITGKIYDSNMLTLIIQ